METQESRRFKGDRHSRKPTRLNPQGTEAGNDSIQDAEVWGALAGAVENQQLMFGEKRTPQQRLARRPAERASKLW
jgi:hypothetical protein